MDNNSVDRETTRLWRANKTIHQLVHDRGYVVSQGELEMTLPEFVTTFAPTGSVLDRNTLSFLVQHAENPLEKLYVFFTEDLSVGVKPIRGFLERMNDQNCSRAVIIYRQSLTPSAAKVMSSMAPKYFLEKFSESELIVNITEHKLVPQHIVLSEEEKKSLLERYRLKETQLPRILMDDPIARYYGLRRGQVVKILRASETAGRYVTYRLAI